MAQHREGHTFLKGQRRQNTSKTIFFEEKLRLCVYSNSKYVSFLHLEEVKIFSTCSCVHAWGQNFRTSRFLDWDLPLRIQSSARSTYLSSLEVFQPAKYNIVQDLVLKFLKIHKKRSLYKIYIQFFIKQL